MIVPPRLLVVDDEEVNRLAAQCYSDLGEVLFGAVADQVAGVAPCADEIRAWVEREPRLDERASHPILTFLDTALRATEP